MTHKAPGKAHREGISLVEITAMFPDDETARKWFEASRWEHGAYCPHCGSMEIQHDAKHPTQTHRCRTCKKFFSAKTGTAMHGSKLGYRIWAIAIYLLTTNLKGVSSMKLHRDLNITQKSAWHLAHRLRKGWTAGKTLFDGPVEIDETYVGGLEKNKHKSKKLNKGRGTVGKTAVIGAKDRVTKQVDAKVIQDTKAETLVDFVASTSSQDATVYTDDHSGYAEIPREHETVKHSVGQYVDEQAHTNGIESFWSILKRGYHGTYHKMSPKHLDRYVSEFAGRHNLRELNTREQMKWLAHGMSGRTLPMKELVSDLNQTV